MVRRVIVLTEPVLNPPPDFTPLIVDIKDAAGHQVIDLSGQLTMYVRARSAETVTLSIALVREARTNGPSTSRA